MVDYKIYVRQAQDAIEEYGLHDSETGQDAFAAWYDKQHKKLVLESSNGEKAQFDLTGYVLSEVDSFLKTKARARFGKQSEMILASTRRRRQKENKNQ